MMVEVDNLTIDFRGYFILFLGAGACVRVCACACLKCILSYWPTYIEHELINGLVDEYRRT